MTRLPLGRWGIALRTGVVFLVGGVFTACCPKPPAPPQPVSACPRNRAPATPAELASCLEGFAFDTGYEVSDEQPLTIIGTTRGLPCPGDSKLSCQYGPIARIEPLIGAQNYSEEDLRQGRIIARISVPRTETQRYEKYGLIPGDTTYWWVQTDSTGKQGKSVFVTATGERTLPSVPRDLVREPYDAKAYRGEKIRRASARWIWTLEDETAKGNCGAAGCH
jgi:hypothetical protein